MKTFSNMRTGVAMFALLAVPATGSAVAQELEPAPVTQNINVYGSLPTDLSGLPAGPEFDGFISSRTGNEIEVTSADGSVTSFVVGAITDIKARGGFLGLGRRELTTASLYNGLPVSVQTVQWEDGLLASEIRFSASDYETAQMVRNGTEQRFANNEMAIEENAAAAEALRGRVANIDQYNVMGVTNVYFDTARHNISPIAQQELCQFATEAAAVDGAQLIVVGYTDSVGNQEYNQALSERRAEGVVNYLQQECGWAPWRMMTPTGMAESDPAADNTTAAGRAQNRRVSVNMLVSKALDEGMGG
ncbi:OmpA family protein [Aurantiacibacter sp. D1-12]|uniref:OmpA family protein n=1 Tax=Aurantiacibacter sp. D1-12 TaxID=2993658 RepID=UPI00237CC053|nr:OmpA family protein [Aurantiacibacter sp. D1-12]MDE1466401.1 OmpA family protein [Aurantiacibacter sp. D1-12]